MATGLEFARASADRLAEMSPRPEFDFRRSLADELSQMYNAPREDKMARFAVIVAGRDAVRQYRAQQQYSDTVKIAKESKQPIVASKDYEGRTSVHTAIPLHGLDYDAYSYVDQGRPTILATSSFRTFGSVDQRYAHASAYLHAKGEWARKHDLQLTQEYLATGRAMALRSPGHPMEGKAWLETFVWFDNGRVHKKSDASKDPIHGILDLSKFVDRFTESSRRPADQIRIMSMLSVALAQAETGDEFPNTRADGLMIHANTRKAGMKQFVRGNVSPHVAEDLIRFAEMFARITPLAPYQKRLATQQAFKTC